MNDLYHEWSIGPGEDNTMRIARKAWDQCKTNEERQRLRDALQRRINALCNAECDSVTPVTAP